MRQTPNEIARLATWIWSKKERALIFIETRPAQSAPSSRNQGECQKSDYHDIVFN
jgi:hypothetical protein